MTATARQRAAEQSKRPFTLQLGDNVSANWDPYLARTSADWSSAGQPITTGVVAGSTSGKRCQPSTGRVEVCNAACGKTGWLGLAKVWFSGNHISQGTAKVNDTYFALDKYNNRGERLHVLCQEIGHTFGLGHTSEDGTSQASCMDYSRSSDTDVNADLATTTAGSSVAPNAHDFEQLIGIYTHTDSTSTASATSSSSARLQPSDDKAAWGREVAHSAQGAWSVFVRQGDKGQRLVTHVTWADEERAVRAHAGHSDHEH